MKKIIIFIILTVLLIFIVDLGAEINLDNLWKPVLVEATGEGRTGMYAVACVYRNRISKGMNLGSSGMKRKDLDRFIYLQGRQQEIIAKDVVYEVFVEHKEDVTGGATYFENIEEFGIPYWYYDMNETCKIGNHTFFKEKE